MYGSHYSRIHGPILLLQKSETVIFVGYTNTSMLWFADGGVMQINYIYIYSKEAVFVVHGLMVIFLVVL